MTRENWAHRKFKPTPSPNHHYWEKTEMTDKELWFSVFSAYASASNSTKPDIGLEWADKALKHWRINHETL